MPRWTSQIIIPNYEIDRGDYTTAVEYKGNIIILQQLYHLEEAKPFKIKLSFFDTEKQEFVSHHKIDTPGNSFFPITAAVSYGDYLYIWTNHDVNDAPQTDIAALFKLNMKSLELDYLLGVNCCVRDDVFILGNVMHALGEGPNLMEANLLIDLTANIITEDSSVIRSSLTPRNLCFFVNNGQIYKIYQVRRCDRVVEKYKDGEWQTVKTDEFGNSEIVFNAPNGRMLLKLLGKPHHYYFDTFNFELCQWERQEIDPMLFKYRDSFVTSSVEIDDVLYVVSNNSSIRTMDISPVPKLSTMCLLSIVDQLTESFTEEDVKKTRKRLCLMTRKKFDNIVHLRLEEREVRLREKFIKEMKKEVRIMKRKQLITREEEVDIRYCFSDPEISDYEEPECSDSECDCNYDDLDE